MRRCLASLSVVLFLLGCGGGGGVTLTPDAQDPDLLASGWIGPAGGSVSVASRESMYFGLAADFPEGALDSEQLIEVWRRHDPLLPENQHSFDFRPEGLTFAQPARITLTYDSSHLKRFGMGAVEVPAAVTWSAASPYETRPTVASDADAQTVSCRTDHFSAFEAAHDGAWRMFCQPAAVDTRFVTEDTRVTRAGSGDLLGKGTAPGFWAAARALLLIHDFSDDAGVFVDSDRDFVSSLDRYYENIAVYEYQSGRSVAESGNRLYELIRDHAQPGFHCVIVGHGTGGLVARHALERAPSEVGGASVAPLVDALLTLGAPHAGTRLDDFLTQTFPGYDPASVADAPRVMPGLVAVRDGIGPISGGPTTRYCLAGSLADHSVDAVSAVDLLGVPNHRRRTFVDPDHDDLHLQAQANGVHEQVLRWFGSEEGRIAWASKPPGGDYDIWVMDPDGGNKRRVTTRTDSESNPVVAPGGRYVVFSSNRDSVNLRLWVVDLDGVDDPRLLAEVRDLNCAVGSFTADGHQLYFYAISGCCEGGLFTVNFDGTGLERLTTGYDGRPFLDPSGRYLLFDRRTSGLSYSHQLYRYDLLTSTVDTCTTGAASEAETTSSGGYSPSGAEIVFARGHMIWIADAACPVDLVGATVLGPGGDYPDYWYQLPTFSPDGQWVVFTYNPGSGDTSEAVYKCRPDGSDFTSLATSAGYDHTPRWGAGRLLPLP